MDPHGPRDGTSRVVRGGSWGSPPGQVRSALRGWQAPATRYSAGYGGIRVVSEWNRLPDLDVAEPKDGAEAPIGTVVVKGVLRSGCGSDVVKVNGSEARRGLGAFEAVVEAEAAGELSIVVTVEGRGAKASVRVERNVIVVAPARLANEVPDRPR